MANLLTQTAEARRDGLPVPDGTYHRGYYYYPVRPAFERAGYMNKGVFFYPKKPRVPLDGAAAYALTCTICTDVVGEARLFTCRELGFRAAHPEYRMVGAS